MIRLCFLALIFVFNFSSSAQEIEWQNTVGGSGNDILYSIAQTSDGGYICGGESISNISGDKTENSQGVKDYWVIKLDGSGNIQWQNTIGGSSNDVLYAISQTADGGYICGGSSYSNISGDKTENGQGADDYWILKLDSTGNIQWQNTIGGNNNDRLSSIVQTLDGGYICGGWSMSGITGDKTEANLGSWDYWVVKLDSSGNIHWQNTIGGSDVDVLYSISPTTDSGFICGGTSQSSISGDKTEASMFNDYWVIKLDSIGDIEWQNTIGGSLYDELYTIYQTSDGGYIGGGYSTSAVSGDKTETSMGGADYWVIKLDSSGAISWQNTLGGNNDDYVSSTIQTANGGYYCAGYSKSTISGDKTEDRQGLNDYWIIMLDSSGNIQWQNTIGGSNDDLLSFGVPTADAGIICGGQSKSNISGDKSEDCMGLIDYWIVKLNPEFNLIQGEIFADLNSNNLHDTGEPSLKNYNITEINSGRFGISDQDGNYSVTVVDSGNFTVTPPALQYYTATPNSQFGYFSSFQQVDSLNDFAYQPVGINNDLLVTITPYSAFRPGMDAFYSLHNKNAGTTSLTGTIIFFPDTGLTFVSSSVNPTSVTTDSVVWQTSLLNPFDEGDIIITVNVDSLIPVGTSINSCVLIEPVTGDADTVNNQECWPVTVTASFDPNVILVNRNSILSTELLFPPYLEYILRFQNTGNDTAFNVKVINPLDSVNLNINTFEFVSSSHPVDISWIPWERHFEFKFNNILLPGSYVNGPLSRGFIRYRIKPQTSLSAGDSIKNKAFIYFDFNNPVVTNTAITEIVLPTFVPSFNNEFDFALYPNPAINIATLSMTLKEDAAVAFQLYNTLGQVILSESKFFTTGKNEIHISVQELPEGVYYVKVLVDENSAVKKLVVFH